MNNLKQRLEAMRRKIDCRAPVAEIHIESQLFVTPEPVARDMVTLADLSCAERILEPSAGTGAILRAIRERDPLAQIDAVEINDALYRSLVAEFHAVNVTRADFLEFRPETRYDKILMNPPFRNGVDVAHIRHAITLLKPGGILVAICANGPRQRKELEPLADLWEPLPRGTFAWTDVATAMISFSA